MSCLLCKHRKRCIVFHAIQNLYEKLAKAEIAPLQKITILAREIREATAKICKYYEEEK